MSIGLTRRRAMAALATMAGLTLAPQTTRAQGQALEPVEIAPGVFVFEGLNELMTSHNNGRICNVGLVIGTSAAAFIDSGGSIIQAQELIAAARKLTQLPIRHLINTHMHPDHVFGNAAFRDLGATIIGHKNLPAALAARRETYLQNFARDMGEAAMQGVEIVPPSQLVETETEIDLGGRTLRLKAWQPAHTDNDLTIIDSASSTLFAGDLAFVNHIPTLDGSFLGWMKQMDDLAALKVKQAVPGHGPAKIAWPQGLDDERRYFNVLGRDLRLAIKSGERMSDAVPKAALSERTRWQLFDEYNERNATSAFAELEWEQ